VLEGDLEVTGAGSVHTAGRDTLLSVPGDARHSGVGRGRVLGIHAPDRGFADSLRRASG
jgi:hypothetical protein